MWKSLFYVYYIINFIETDQGPRANKIMFYTADRKSQLNSSIQWKKKS